jgi:hypothetical protein
MPKRVRRLAVLILTYEEAAPLATAGMIATLARLRQVALTLVDVG